MESHGCFNGTLSDTKYSSPIPNIGLYITAATLVCMFFMIYDILVGCRTRKRWLPCKMFKLDSITLTLISIAVKLTVDLTTPMPSVLDQLSKICGTCMLCVYMGFILPSVGVMNDSTNMYSLSILVITVFVNMCIQISTGVVVLFIPEHIIILCIMLIVLGMVWSCVWKLKVITRYTHEESKIFFRRSKETVLERLKICYLYGYSFNPQLIACKEISSSSVGGLNFLCLVILIQATYRSVIVKSEKFCGGNSDYDWSIPMIVWTQILTVIVGSSVSIFRWLTMLFHISSSVPIGEGGEPYKSNPIWAISIKYKRNSIKKLWFLISKLGNIITFFVWIITLPVTYLPLIFLSMEKLKSGDNTATEEFKYLIEEKIGINEWTLRKGLTEMEKERDISRSEQNELFQLLSIITPSQQSQVEHITERVGFDGESVRVSTLSVVLLIRIAQVSLPKHLNCFLVKTFWDVYEFLCFIEKNLFLRSPEFAKKLEVAKAVWLANDFSHLVVKTFDKWATGQSQFDPSCALAIIAEVKSKMPGDMIYSELSIIENYINRRQYSSIKELYLYIEQLLVDMLHVILAQFPIATFNALTESPDEDYHERVRLALKFVYKIEPLEDRIQWKFPHGSNLLGLIAAPVLAIEVETEDTAAIAIHDVITEVEDSNLRTVC